MNVKNITTVFLLLLTLSGISFAEMIDRIVAKVNGDIITFSELEKVVYSIAKVNTENKKELRKIFNRNKKDVLNKIIEQNLQLQYAKQNKMEASKNDVDNAVEDIKKNNNFSDEMFEMMLEREGMTLESYRASMKRQITINRVLSSEIRSRIKVNEKEIEKYYRKNKRKFLKPEEIRVYHIIFVVKDKENEDESKKQRKKALHVLKKLKKGRDFKELAKIYSEGPSKDGGGDLGWVKRGSMISSFEKVAFSLRKGEISNLVKTDYGYHIIKVEDRREAKYNTLSEAREEIKKILFKKKYDDKYKKWMTELKKNAFIEIYLENKSYEKKRYASLKNKRKRANIHNKRHKSSKKISRKTRTKKPQKTESNKKYVSSSDKVKISKLILKWEAARETKNRRRFFAFYSKDFKINGLNRDKWEKIIEKEHEVYKFINIEIRDFRIFKSGNFYIATFDQRFKSNIDDKIKLVRLYLTKDKNRFKIAKEKWLNSPDTYKEFSQKTLLSWDTLPKAASKLSGKKKRLHILQPLGLL